MSNNSVQVNRISSSNGDRVFRIYLCLTYQQTEFPEFRNDVQSGRWRRFHRELNDLVQEHLDQALLVVYVDGEEPRLFY